MFRAALVGVLILLSLCALPSMAQEGDTGGTSDTGTAAGGTVVVSPTVLSALAGVEDFLPAYPLSVGDVVTVEYFTPSISTYEVTVDGNGTIVVPPAGRVRVLGLTTEKAAAMLEEKLALYYKDVTVVVNLVRLAPVKVFVFGATNRAGVYVLRGGTTMLEFLQQLRLTSWGQYRQIHHYRFTSFFLGREEQVSARENGFLLDGKDKSVENDEAGAVSTDALREADVLHLVGDEEAFFALVRLQNAEDTIVDPTDFVALGELKNKNFLLRDGDIIYFPLPGKSVTVYGSNRPGVYEVLPGEGLLEVLRRAGEVIPQKDLAHTVIERVDEAAQLTFQVIDLDKYYYSQEEPTLIPLANGDRIRILPYQEFVTVLGAVGMAGRIPYNPSFGVFEYIASAGGNTDNARMSKVMVVRGTWDAGGSFNLGDAFVVNADDYAAGRELGMPPLLPGDVIYVPIRDDLTKRDVASILSSLTVSALALFK